MSDQKTTPAWANTRISARLGIKYPIIQGPLGGFSSQRLTAAVSNYGGLGSFGAHGLARGIKNRLLDTMNAPGVEILPYPLHRFLMRNISGPAEKSGRQELIPMWAGQSANLAHHTKATELLDALVSGVSAMIDGQFCRRDAAL